jgi:hypothetical protein
MRRFAWLHEHHFRWFVSLAIAIAVGFASSDAKAWIITATGTIYSNTGVNVAGVTDQTGLFGPPGASLIGDTYTETISTNPALNTYATDLTTSFHDTYGGAGIGGCCGAPYIITVTVNGVTYTQTESLL